MDFIKNVLEKAELHFDVSFWTGDSWQPIPLTFLKKGAALMAPGLSGMLTFQPYLHGAWWQLDYTADFPTRFRLSLRREKARDVFHLIPANLYGDNNRTLAKPNEFPTLGEKVEGDRACAPLWEFRADRAALPVSLVACERGVYGLSVEPYLKTNERKEQFARSGVFAALPATCGVSTSYGNDPLTFENKRQFSDPTCQLLKKAEVRGRLFVLPDVGRDGAHQVLRDLYREMREAPSHRNSTLEGARGLAEAFIQVNYSPDFHHYTNMSVPWPVEKELKHWRGILEIGWTGGGVLAYPMLLAEKLFPDLQFPKPPREILDDIAGAYNPDSGFINDVTGRTFLGDLPSHWTGWERNGWWSGFLPHLENKHCAYTNGSAVTYLLMAADFCEKNGAESHENWVETALKVLETVCELQRGDGCLGYGYEPDSRAVCDWDGFAGCWFVPALVLAWQRTGNPDYLKVARRAMNYYAKFVYALFCYGTPMDTWKSVDEEGNLAFIRAARMLHEATGENAFLDMLEAGALYEYTWRYGFRARPEFEPLKRAGWNSCGGSVTSVSNPHVHPMAMLATDDLRYLAEKTCDDYHAQRAEDGVRWLLQTMELYPDAVEYAPYGVLSERFCPSDGLAVEKYHDTGERASTWWSYNAWAAANALECLALCALKGT